MRYKEINLYQRIRRRFSRRFDADTYVISYPKSGRTWLRALIGKYLAIKYNFPENKILSTELLTQHSGLPIVSFIHDESGMKAGTPYRDLSSDRQKYKNKKVLLLGRDIKDTLVSAYFQATKRRNVFEGTISEFIVSDRFGVLKILRFYDIWLQNQHVPRAFCFIRYEDLHRDPEGVLTRVLDFIGEDRIEETLVAQSIEYCAFQNLKKMEERNTFNNRALKPAKTSDLESFKVRKGKVGGYTEYLSTADIAFIDKTIEAHGFAFSGFTAT
jgi:hypothetical protein